MHLVHIKLCVSQKNVSDSTVYSTISLTNLPAGGIAGVQEIILSFVGGSIMVKDIEAMGCCAVSKWKVQDLCNIPDDVKAVKFRLHGHLVAEFRYFCQLYGAKFTRALI